MTDTTKIVQELTAKITDLNKQIGDATVGQTNAQGQADDYGFKVADATALRDQYQALLNSVAGGQ